MIWHTPKVATEAAGLFWNKYSANKELELVTTGLNQQGLLYKFLTCMSEKRERRQGKTKQNTQTKPTKHQQTVRRYKEKAVL